MSANGGGWRDLSFDGRSAVVTAAARGVGRAIAHRLAGLGARTVIWDRDAEPAERAAAELRDRLISLDRPHDLEWAQVDVADPEDVDESMAAAAVDGLDVLVNNAAITLVHKLEGAPNDVWEKTVAVNLGGVFYCCRAAAPYLKQRPGAAIVNISSSTALTGGGGGAHYAASKAGIDGLTRHLAQELAPEIRVNSVQPRSIETEGFHAFMQAFDDPAAVQQRSADLNPLRRLGQPEDIADVVAFLASDWASYINGQLLLVDGGRTYQ